MNRRLRRGPARFLLIPLVLVIGAGVWYVRVLRESPVPEAVVRTVRVTRPERVDLEDSFSLRAFVEADETVTILPLVSGTIRKMHVDVGDTVEANQVIAQIDPARYELSLSQAQASFTAAESTWERTRRLYEANATTVQNFDHARAQFEAARSQRDLAQLQLGYTSVAVPVEGVVLARHLAGGDVASPERPLMTVGDISRLVVRAAVPEERYSYFATSRNTLALRVEAAGRSYPARIRTVAPYVQSETRTFQVVCDLTGDVSILRPGMSVTVTFVLKAIQDVPTIPQESLGYGGTLWYVEDSRAYSMEAPDLFSDDERMQLPEEESHRTFIVQGHHFLSDGQRVEIIGER